LRFHCAARGCARDGVQKAGGRRLNRSDAIHILMIFIPRYSWIVAPTF
jgi:hypothetical protein